MPQFTIQCHLSELPETLEKEKFSFLEKLLFAIGLPVLDHFPDGLSDCSTQTKMKLRKFLFDFGNNIFIQEFNDGEMKILFQDNLIGHLEAPKKSLFFDPATKETKFSLQYRYSSIFEKE